jgi:hypothetical protein
MEITMKRVLLLVLGSLLLALPVSATQYYVSPAGNDNNSGTSPSSPWATLSKVNNFVFNGGDTVSFQGGQTFTGCLVFNSSTVQNSSASTPFTVNSYGAGMATIQSGCTGNTSAAVIADNVNGFYLNGLKIVNGFATGASSSTASGVLIENQSSNLPTQTVVVENSEITGFAPPSGSSNTGGDIVIIGDAMNGNNGPLNDIQILNNTLHGASVTAGDFAGIGGYGFGENITNVLVQGNTVYNIGGAASDTGAGIVANGWNGATIQYNLIHDIGANVTSCGGISGIEAYTSNNVTVRFNEVYNVQPSPGFTTGCDWDGIDLDGGTSNSVVEYNYTHHNGGPGLLAYDANVDADTWGNNTFRFNISENDQWLCSQYNSCSGVFAVVPNAPANPLYIYGNTLFQNMAGNQTQPAACFYLGYGSGAWASGSLIADNICDMNNYDEFNRSVFFYNPGPYTMTVSNNLYYSTHSASWRWGANSYSSLSQWQTAGIESNPIEGDPLFSNAGNGGTCNWSPSQASGPQPCPSAYTLQSGSPAIAAGVPVSNNGGRDYYGNAIPATPNIGAQAGSGSGSLCHTGTWCAQANLPASPSYGSLFQTGSWVASQSNWVASIWIQGSGSIQLQALYNSTVLAETECTATSTWTQCSTPVFNTGSAGVNRFNIIGYYGGPATMYIDDTFLGPAGGSNQLQNAGFENGNSFWNIDGGGQGVYTIGQFSK